MNQNPSLQIGIDGSMDPRGSDPRDAFGDTQLTRDRRVEVLFSTSK